jgi:hypothetical protein
MVIFPATLPHYVTSYEGTDKRITIAFNLRHTRFAVADFENPYSRRRTLWRDYRGPDAARVQRQAVNSRGSGVGRTAGEVAGQPAPSTPWRQLTDPRAAPTT